jgi:hypothetical protein
VRGEGRRGGEGRVLYKPHMYRQFAELCLQQANKVSTESGLLSTGSGHVASAIGAVIGLLYFFLVSATRS